MRFTMMIKVMASIKFKRCLQQIFSFLEFCLKEVWEKKDKLWHLNLAIKRILFYHDSHLNPFCPIPVAPRVKIAVPQPMPCEACLVIWNIVKASLKITSLRTGYQLNDNFSPLLFKMKSHNVFNVFICGTNHITSLTCEWRPRCSGPRFASTSRPRADTEN